ncbi:MAG: pentapeptide repeat-containing protein [Dehalococcoidia bacterium]
MFRIQMLLKWTGFQGKTLWDWMQLLFIPLFIAAAGAFSFFELQREEQRAANQRLAEERRAANQLRIEMDQARESALQSYLDRMTELLLDTQRRPSNSNEARNVARARTITILRNLNGMRNQAVLRFLLDADLLVKRGQEEGDSLMFLKDADLSGTDLTGVDFHDVNLHGANLSEANLARPALQDSNLIGVDLSNARLAGANLTRALLKGADLCGAFVFKAELANASLENALLLNTELSGANLTRPI